MYSSSNTIQQSPSISIFIRVVLLLTIACGSCQRDPDTGIDPAGDSQNEVIIKRRTDGTLSSVNQVDEMGWVHGLRVTYYRDGKTIFSKTVLEHGIKNGPFIRYYKNGQKFEHTSYRNGKKHGPSRKYYKNGRLMAEFTYGNGYILPGLKEYDRKGKLVSDYPEIRFKEEDHLESRSRVDLIVSPNPEYPGIKYYLKQRNNGKEERIYLISEKGVALTQHYIQPGSSLKKKVEIIAEIPTELGNTMVKDLVYDLTVSNPY